MLGGGVCFGLRALQGPMNVQSIGIIDDNGRVRYVRTDWVAVKELKSSYYIGETLLFTIYIYPLW